MNAVSAGQYVLPETFSGSRIRDCRCDLLCHLEVRLRQELFALEGEEKPLCVEWCLNDVLVYEEREEEVEAGEEQEELDIGLTSLVEKHGKQKVIDAMARMSASTKKS